MYFNNKVIKLILLGECAITLQRRHDVISYCQHVASPRDLKNCVKIQWRKVSTKRDDSSHNTILLIFNLFCFVCLEDNRLQDTHRGVLKSQSKIRFINFARQSGLGDQTRQWKRTSWATKSSFRVIIVSIVILTRRRKKKLFIFVCGNCYPTYG